MTRLDRDRFLLIIAFLAFGLWLFAIGPARAWAGRVGAGAHWAMGVAPKFFAGLTFSHWQAYLTTSNPVTSAASAALLVALAEAAQLVLPGYTADAWDVVAGIVGASLAMPILSWRVKRRARVHHRD